MRLNDILDSIELTQSHAQFESQPNEPYLVWYDNVKRRGADSANLISEHAVSFELYSPYQDDDSEIEIETALDSFAQEWDKTDRQWLETEQLFITIYDFNYIEKED